jgi:hypothetical protein
VIVEIAEAIHAKNETLGLVPDVVHFERLLVQGMKKFLRRPRRLTYGPDHRVGGFIRPLR